jgi:hypothetical protein
LDASRDFSGISNGTAIAQWNGVGIASSTQATSSARPTYSGKAVTFDGGDFLSFPMWNGGIGSAWTLAALIKFDAGLANYQTFWGSNGRVLETYWFNDGAWCINGAGTEAVLITDKTSYTTPNSNWRRLIITSDGTTTTVYLDGVVLKQTLAMGIVASLSGSWRVGKSHDGATPAKFTLRYLSFYPRVLNAGDINRLKIFLRAKKNSEAPATNLLIGGGQSNWVYSHRNTDPTLAAAISNPTFANHGGVGGTPLYYWWWFKNNDPAQGMEVCPAFDVSAATPGSAASYQVGKFQGQATIDYWDAALDAIVDNTRTNTFIRWIEGETMTGDSRENWLPNNSGNWTSIPSDPYYFADNYATLAAGWNAYLRGRYGAGAYMLYHYISLAYDPGPVQTEGIARRNWNVRQAMRTDANWFANDITDFPREPDNIHLTNTDSAAGGGTPNSGSEALGRAQLRLINAAAKLATLGYEARMLAMRAIDVGFELTNAQMDACTAFAASTGYSDIYSLVVPVLPATNTAFDRPRARRCNLMAHAKDRYNTKFVTSAPANTTVTVNLGANVSAITTAVTNLLTAWGLSDTITVNGATIPFSILNYTPLVSVAGDIAASKWDGSDATAADGVGVKTWRDQSGNNAHYVSATAGQRGLSQSGLVSFDGSDDNMLGAAQTFGASWTVVAVLKRNSGTGYACLFSPNDVMSVLLTPGGGVGIGNNASFVTTAGGVVPSNGTKYLLITRFSPSDAGIWINSTRRLTGNTGSGTSGGASTRLMKRFDGLNLAADLYEIHVWTRALSDTEVTEIYTGLMAKHGL